jgi:response regulator of citrate/malate metabolism
MKQERKSQITQCIGTSYQLSNWLMLIFIAKEMEYKSKKINNSGAKLVLIQTYLTSEHDLSCLAKAQIHGQNAIHL